MLLLGNERFRVPEILFTPENVGLDQMGIAEMAAEAIFSCAPGLRNSL